jgi:hypothetical protein
VIDETSAAALEAREEKKEGAIGSRKTHSLCWCFVYVTPLVGLVLLAAIAALWISSDRL